MLLVLMKRDSSLTIKKEKRKYLNTLKQQADHSKVGQPKEVIQMEDKTRALSMIRKLRDDTINYIEKLATEVEILNELLDMVALLPERDSRALAWRIDKGLY